MTRHAPFTQAAAPFITVQSLPQAPQFETSTSVLVSQPFAYPPSAAVVSQLAQPSSHDCTAQAADSQRGEP
jgi:hypothetical protein